MITRMKINFEEDKMTEFCQYSSIMGRLGKLRDDPVGKLIVTKIYKTKPHSVDVSKSEWHIYWDLIIYFDDNYQKAMDRVLRPFYQA